EQVVRTRAVGERPATELLGLRIEPRDVIAGLTDEPHAPVRCDIRVARAAAFVWHGPFVDRGGGVSNDVWRDGDGAYRGQRGDACTLHGKLLREHEIILHLMDIIEILQKIRKAAGDARTIGLPDDVLRRFAKHDSDLRAAVEAAPAA